MVQSIQEKRKVVGDSPTIHDSEGNTVGENAKFYMAGSKGDSEFEGVVLDLLDADLDTSPKVKVKFSDGVIDYLGCTRRDPDSEVYICHEIVVEDVS